MNREDVQAMGLELGPVCEQTHGRGMKPHHHITLPEKDRPVAITHSCPVCGAVHLPFEWVEGSVGGRHDEPT